LTEYADGAFESAISRTGPIAPDTYGQILTPTVDAWWRPPAEITLTDADELRSILTSVANLASHRAGRRRYRLHAEKEVVKRRLAASSSAARACVRSSIRRWQR
jgi:hypothetical protein